VEYIEYSSERGKQAEKGKKKKPTQHMVFTTTLLNQQGADSQMAYTG